MKYLLLLFASVLVCGCDKSMSNDQIIAEIAKCKRAGLNYREMEYAFSKHVAEVQCEKP